MSFCPCSSRTRPSTIGAAGAQSLRNLDSGFRHPVPGQKQPERKAGIGPIAAKTTDDRGVRDLLLADEPCVLRPRPGVEYETRVAAEQHHHVRRGVRAYAGEREQAL